MKNLIFLFLLFSQVSFGGSQKKLGSYQLTELSRLKIGCTGSEFNSIVLVPEESAECRGSMNIKKVVISYRSGIDQEFELSSSGHNSGATFQTTRFNVLPGTKCLESISAQISNSAKGSCRNSNRVKVVLN